MLSRSRSAMTANPAQSAKDKSKREPQLEVTIINHKNHLNLALVIFFEPRIHFVWLAGSHSQEFVNTRDYVGGMALLNVRDRTSWFFGHGCRNPFFFQFKRQSRPDDDSLLPWLTYCAFHLGDYKKALEVLKQWSIKLHHTRKPAM